MVRVATDGVEETVEVMETRQNKQRLKVEIVQKNCKILRLPQLFPVSFPE
jgi:hypothetical protein